MKLNRMIAFVMVLMFAAVLFAGCASEPVAEETTTETPAAEGATATEDTAALPGEGIKVGLLVPDSIVDPGWSQTGANGKKSA